VRVFVIVFYDELCSKVTNKCSFVSILLLLVSDVKRAKKSRDE
jgi:hypothetical protein